MNALEEKKGEKIVLMDIHEIASFADFFIICNGTSDRMLDSLAESVVDKGRKLFNLPGKVEGEAREGWIVIDLGDIVVHLFSPDQRSYYQLEQLWERGKILVRLQ